MTRGTIYVAVASAVLALAAPAFAEIKIGIVDLQRALNESAAGKKAKEQFKVEFDRMQGSLKGEKDKLDKMKEDLDKQGAVLKPDDRKAKGLVANASVEFNLGLTRHDRFLLRPQRLRC